MSAPVAIYKIVNAVNGKMYIGQSINPIYRFRRHFWKHNGCTKLGNAIAKYGRINFHLSILCWCVDKTDANEVEELLIDLGNTQKDGYNITPGGFGTGSGEANPFFGKKHSAELKLSWSQQRRGKPMPAEVRKKIASANKNRIVSEATKEKLRGRPKSDLCSERTAAANKTRVWSESAKLKLVAHNTGKKMSAETKAKIAAANKLRIWTPESKAKLSASKNKKVAA